MNHEEVVQLLGPYQDGELDLGTCLKLEEHLAGCPLCQQKLGGEKELVDLIRSEAPCFKASPFLKTRIQAALRKEPFSSATIPWWKHFSTTWKNPVLIGFSFLLVVLVADIFWSQRRMPTLAQESVANHVRSLQVSHLVDVASSDQHTVKPWFAGKLDYSPQVVDLSSSGYPLIGGRLDILDHRNVAAIVYQRRKHYINLFIWPSNTEVFKVRLHHQNGYQVLEWTKSGMNYLAVSELGEKELREFAEMIQTQMTDFQSKE